MSRLATFYAALTLTFLCIFSSFASSQPTFGPARLLLTTQDWPPYQDFNHGQMTGIAIKILIMGK